MEHNKIKQAIAAVVGLLFLIAIPLYSVGVHDGDTSLTEASIYMMLPLWVFMVYETINAFTVEIGKQIQKKKEEKGH